jgi:hypothetical protein
MYANFNSMHGACGVGVYHCFRNERIYQWEHPIKFNAKGGAGWVTAGFVNTTQCHEAYKKLSKKYKLVWQSPVRRNSNSGRDFFFAVWDTRKEKK